MDKEKSYKIRGLMVRLKNIIRDKCEGVGCKNCDVKWDDSCTALKLQDDIFELEQGSGDRIGK